MEFSEYEMGRPHGTVNTKSTRLYPSLFGVSELVGEVGW